MAKFSGGQGAVPSRRRRNFRSQSPAWAGWVGPWAEPPLYLGARHWPASIKAHRGYGAKVLKVTVQPINLIFRYLENRSQIQVWLSEQVIMWVEGCIIDFNEYINLVLDDAEEIHSKTKSRKQLGQIMPKRDITLFQSIWN
ncbi:small nuclear ribonucleoprotein E-like [Sorex araneus]|uniref:small nuclear ribonucleoprotein E-like n=1 Tax=Sorex araneus TaxID=42254 RepID=UPI0024338CBC|nr:small nuclear ribonucleoprotein E-like [Sorex araneus]